ncbi:transcriptional regulator [Caulobacter sp. Root1455]|jgi:CRP/FNR family nitrogen fixation transcriptional regulator|uniref:transcriptional regulator FixK n=1 Tax=unclassified Caulobacter TaxID=2648921 RepID=UPI0006F9B9F2|nr:MULTISPECIES: helix-turn-helix domain-containing protein [unclassified Caulobacter]KQY29421.1 transcriptional regulator [Caulobacter sp. Root487D2Y]KQY95990.1 transcriptional regulator [Caulobacter sp. Root1455]
MLSVAQTPAPTARQPAAIVLDGLHHTYGRGETIFDEGEPADRIYQLISGSLRTCRILRDGRRQIEAFHFAGDVFGLESGETYRVAAETLSPTIVRVMPRSALEALACERGDVARRLLELTTDSLRRAQDHVLMLGGRAACERVAALLLDLAERTGARALLDVPMTRQDMADYLGLTIETVSRTFTQFQHDGLIALPTTRKVLLRDRSALEAMVD